jgi:hypothetical protein
MHHLGAWSESQDSAVLTNIAAIADPQLRVQGDDIIVPTLSLLGATYFVGANITQAQLVSPSIRRYWPFDVSPVDRNAEPTVPTPFLDWFDRPLALTAGEAMDALMAEDSAGASRVTAFAWFVDGPAQPVSGDIFTIRASNASTLVAFAWTNGALTLSQALPVGTYDLVGMRAESAGLLAARAVFVGGGWRPGVIGYDAAGDFDWPRFRRGAIGVWGTFDNLTPPSIDFLSVSADTSQTVWLDLIRRS